MAGLSGLAYLPVWGASEDIIVGGQYNVTTLHCIDQGRFEHFLNTTRKEALCIKQGRLNVLLLKVATVTVGL